MKWGGSSISPRESRGPLMKIRAQIAMVLNLDKWSARVDMLF